MVISDQIDCINAKYNLYYLVVRHNYEKENTPEGPTQKGLREAREQSKSKTKKKDNKKVWYAVYYTPINSQLITKYLAVLKYIWNVDIQKERERESETEGGKMNE